MKYKQNIPSRGKPANKDRLYCSSQLKFIIRIVDMFGTSIILFTMNDRIMNSMEYACDHMFVGKICKDVDGIRTIRNIQNRDREFPRNNWLNLEPGPSIRPGFLSINYLLSNK
jgi:hypothetical protein